MANDGGAGKDGLPRNPLVRLVFIKTSEGFLPHVPLLFQKLVLGLAGLIARVSGVKKRLAKYYSDEDRAIATTRAWGLESKTIR